jgi:hypothetical protein
LHAKAFGNRDGLIHIIKDGTLDQVFESLEKMLDLEFCPCGQAVFGDWLRGFELAVMLTYEVFDYCRAIPRRPEIGSNGFIRV